MKTTICCLAFVFLVSTGCSKKPQPIEELPIVAIPKLGAALPAEAEKKGIVYVRSCCGMDDYYRVNTTNGVYGIGVAEGKITYISPHDSTFRTPEGIGKGSFLTDALSVAGANMLRHSPFAPVSQIALPSGWIATFPKQTNVTWYSLGESTSEPTERPKVKSVFKSVYKDWKRWPTMP